MSVQVIPAEFTLSELLAFVEGEGQEVAEGYYTTQEWADHFGIHVTRMRRIIRKGQEQGLVDLMWAKRTRIDSRVCTLPVYAFKSDST